MPDDSAIARIDDLANRARETNATEDWHDAAMALLALPTLWAIGDQDKPDSPVVIELPEGKAVAMFTTAERAKVFAETNESLKGKEPRVFEMPRAAAIAHLRRTNLAGAPAVLVDPGSTQWGFVVSALVVLAHQKGLLPPPTTRKELDKLVHAYRASQTPETDQALWRAVFRLPSWRFVATGEEPNLLPFVGEIGGKPYLAAFTDQELCWQFAVRHKLERSKPEATVLSVDVDRAVQAAQQFVQIGVFGMVVNPDVHGFFAPLENLGPMFHWFMAEQGRS